MKVRVIAERQYGRWSFHLKAGCVGSFLGCDILPCVSTVNITIGITIVIHGNGNDDDDDNDADDDDDVEGREDACDGDEGAICTTSSSQAGDG